MSPRKQLKKETRKRKKSHKRRKLHSAWKEVIEKFFEDVMELLFPKIYDTIDFSKKFEFLDTAMRPLAAFGDHGDRAADVLVKVQLKSGKYNYIHLFIHIEVQSERRENLMERIYIYNYRSFDKRLEASIPVISLLILADDDENYRPDEYKMNFCDFELRMKIPMVKLIDFNLKKELREKLEKSTSPIAVVIRTQLKSMELKKADDKTKLAAARELMRECYHEGYSRDVVHTMVKFLVWVIRSSKEYEKQLKEEIKKIEEELNMPYVIPWERTAERRGRRKGREEGIEVGRVEGIEAGKVEGKKETAKNLLSMGLDIDKIVKATGLKKEIVETLKITSS
jgi:predicted transposase/invertase (TIGR01784 family)